MSSTQQAWVAPRGGILAPCAVYEAEPSNSCVSGKAQLCKNLGVRSLLSERARPAPCIKYVCAAPPTSLFSLV